MLLGGFCSLMPLSFIARVLLQTMQPSSLTSMANIVTFLDLSGLKLSGSKRLLQLCGGNGLEI